MTTFRGSPRYGGLWFVYCIRRNVSDFRWIASTSPEHGRTSRNLPPLTRGSNQPWYSNEGFPAMIVWLSPAVGRAKMRTRTGNSKGNVRSIFRKLKAGEKKERERERKPTGGGGWGGEREGGRETTAEIDETSWCLRRPSPSFPSEETLGYHGR